MYSIGNYLLPNIKLLEEFPNQKNMEFYSSKADKDAISVALGRIAHILCLISKYFELPLPFKLILSSNRSQISNSTQKQYFTFIFIYSLSYL